MALFGDCSSYFLVIVILIIPWIFFCSVTWTAVACEFGAGWVKSYFSICIILVNIWITKVDFVLLEGPQDKTFEKHRCSVMFI